MDLIIPTTVTTSCPMKEFKQRYLIKGCLKCEYFKGVDILTKAEEVDTKDPVTGKVTGKRSLGWHEKNVIRCAFPMTRRCFDLSVVEE